MKFVDIRAEQEVLCIDITLPSPSEIYEYYYPDGLTKGWIRKKTYFLKDLVWSRYYMTPQEALRNNSSPDLFLKDGRIWIKGKVRLVLRSQPTEEIIMKFEDLPDLMTYLGNLETRWGVGMNSLVALEEPIISTLYEYKSNSFTNPKE